jgi:hypothetical protein
MAMLCLLLVLIVAVGLGLSKFKKRNVLNRFIA